MKCRAVVGQVLAWTAFILVNCPHAGPAYRVMRDIYTTLTSSRPLWPALASAGRAGFLFYGALWLDLD